MANSQGILETELVNIEVNLNCRRLGVRTRKLKLVDNEM